MGVIRLGWACLFPGLGSWAGRGPAGHPEAEVSTGQRDSGPWPVSEGLWLPGPSGWLGEIEGRSLTIPLFD